MPAIEVAVLDAGPLIHLEEIRRLPLLRLIRRGLLTEDVVREVGRGKHLPPRCTVRALEGRAKDVTVFLAQEHRLGQGEASSIALAKQEGVRLSFTDDLDAREVSYRYGLEAHGTLALLTRAFREGMLTRAEALESLRQLHEESSLYLTEDLVRWARSRIGALHRRG